MEELRHWWDFQKQPVMATVDNKSLIPIPKINATARLVYENKHLSYEDDTKTKFNIINNDEQHKESNSTKFQSHVSVP